MNIATIKIDSASDSGFALTATSKTGQRTVYAVPYNVDFAKFMLQASDQSLVEIPNQDHKLHDNTAWGFGAWAAAQFGKVVNLYAADRQHRAVWPASPFIASPWSQYTIKRGTTPIGTLFRAVEPRNDEWARRLTELPGGQSQRISELYAVLASNGGEIVPFPLELPQDGATPLVFEYVTKVTEPTWSSALSALSGDPSLTYSSQTRWSQLIPPSSAAAFVGGKTTTADWEDAVPPFNGVGDVGVSELELFNDGASTLAFRFGPGTFEVSEIAAGASQSVSIPSGEVYWFTEHSRLQVKTGASGELYRIKFRVG